MSEPDDREFIVSPPDQRSAPDYTELLVDPDATLPPLVDLAKPYSDTIDPGLGRVGPYILRQELRRWHRGAVYRATHRQLRRDVEIQLLDTSATESERIAFLDSARAIAQMDSPLIAHDLLEAGIADGTAYMAREFAKGDPVTGFGPRARATTPAELLFPNDDLAVVVRDAAGALAALQSAGLTHVRINSERLRRDANGRIKLYGLGESTDRTANDGQSLGDAIAAWVCPPDAPLRPDHWATDVRKLNPGVSRTLIADVSRLRSGDCTAADLAVTAEPITRRHLVPTSFADRGFSMIIEVTGVVVIWLIGLLVLGIVTGWRATNLLAAWHAIFLAYFPIMETLCYGTPYRLMRGLRLVDASGEAPPRWRLFLRSILRLSALGMVIALLMAIGAWRALDGSALLVEPTTASFLMPALGLALYYLPTLFWRDRLCLHDRLTGVFVAQPAPAIEPELRSTHLMAFAKPISEDTSTVQADPALTRSLAEAQAHTTTNPLSGGSVDQYDIDRLLGEGGMASVYLVRDRHLGRAAALKIVRDGTSDAASLERFRREAELSAQIDHAHVAKVIGAGRMPFDDGLYFVMEYLSGRNLAQVARAGPVDVANVWDWMIQAAEGLQAADRLGIIHRDIKPSNLMLSEFNTVKVTDFGISKALGDLDDIPSATAWEMLPADANLTRTGALLGTPMFMSPEQTEGLSLDRRSDIYSLGLTLLSLLTGDTPYPTSSVQDLLRFQATTLPPRLLQPIAGLTPARRAILMRMLAKCRNDRYADYDVLLNDLRRTAPRPWTFARFRFRAGAELVNMVVTSVAIAMIPYVTLIVVANTFDIGPFRQSALGLFVFATTYWMYLWGVGRHGSTLGKRLHRLRVVGLNGEPIGCWRALLRYVIAYPGTQLQLLSTVAFLIGGISFKGFQMVNNLAATLFCLTMAVAFVMTWRHPQRRTLHDLAAGTVVIRLDPDQVEPRLGWRWWLPW